MKYGKKLTKLSEYGLTIPDYDVITLLLTECISFENEDNLEMSNLVLFLDPVLDRSDQPTEIQNSLEWSLIKLYYTLGYKKYIKGFATYLE